MKVRFYVFLLVYALALTMLAFYRASQEPGISGCARFDTSATPNFELSSLEGEVFLQAKGLAEDDEVILQVFQSGGWTDVADQVANYEKQVELSGAVLLYETEWRGLVKRGGNCFTYKSDPFTA